MSHAGAGQASSSNRIGLGYKVIAGLVALAGSLAVFFNTPAGDRTCSSLARNGFSFPIFCPESVESVGLDDATTFLDKYIGRAGASTPRNAWAMLSPGLQEDVTLRSFEKAWEPVDWAERIGTVTPGAAYNSFILRYRTYDGLKGGYGAKKGRVTEYNATVVIRKTDKPDLSTNLALEIDQFGPANRDSVQSVPFASAHLTRMITPLERPWIGAQTTAPQGAGTLAVYCEVQGDEPDGVTWVRTGLGWLPVDGESVYLEQAPPLCDSHHLQAKE